MWRCSRRQPRQGKYLHRKFSRRCPRSRRRNLTHRHSLRHLVVLSLQAGHGCLSSLQRWRPIRLMGHGLSSMFCCLIDWFNVCIYRVGWIKDSIFQWLQSSASMLRWASHGSSSWWCYDMIALMISGTWIIKYLNCHVNSLFICYVCSKFKQFLICHCKVLSAEQCKKSNVDIFFL